MLKFRELQLAHLQYIVPHSVQTDEYKWLMMPGIGAMLLNGFAVSGWVDGRCIGAAGVYRQHDFRGECWMILSEHAAPYTLPIVRQIRAVLDRTEHKRVDCTTQINATGLKLATLCGFELETTLEAWGVNGEDMYLWKRIKR